LPADALMALILLALAVASFAYVAACERLL
jgi:hypothetical protein